jgi:hypothetical protein
VMHALEERVYAHQIIEKLFIKLHPREERVLRLRFGLDGVGEHTRKEIAEDLGRSTTLVEILELRALRKLERRVSLDSRLSLGPLRKYQPLMQCQQQQMRQLPPLSAPGGLGASPGGSGQPQSPGGPPGSPPIEGEDYWRRDALMNGGGGYRLHA